MKDWIKDIGTFIGGALCFAIFGAAAYRVCQLAASVDFGAWVPYVSAGIGLVLLAIVIALLLGSKGE